MSSPSLLGRQAQDGSTPWWYSPVFTTHHSPVVPLGSFQIYVVTLHFIATTKGSQTHTYSSDSSY
ncbi:hypothetical protein FOVSG1_014310 [Fusarium oxysporum f. sp. vasinfectum]